MLRPWPIKPEATFTADIDDQQLFTPLAITDLSISLKGSPTAAAAHTADEILALITQLELKHGPDAKVRLSGEEIFAFNHLFLGHAPKCFDCGAETAQAVRVMDMRIPVNLPSGHGPDYWNIDYTAATGIDTTLLTLLKIQTEGALPGTPLKILPYNYTPPSTGVFNKALEYSPEGIVEAIMFKMTTPPDETQALSSISNVRVDIGGVEQAKESIYSFVGDIFYSAKIGDAEIRRVLETYALLDLRADPIPAGVDLRLMIDSATADAIKIYPIERLV